ncbi:threonine-phosphate decarboxylase CobD [Polycladomyces subterraneus]|uniref:threonine-phosphate decarboxylase n=1 Tax=Polycladomyces subterraneus TaxID=1016997 RepID=A0ABT8IM18_9BACL|nr:threonine-phosphate decarboxylase CobD [Polycladomyces subterraneus]MDN4593809.1 threonine-phosphate decarboxylase CobD [Polycladomyces subterraneus]
MSRLERYGHGGDRVTASELFGLDPDSFLDFSANIVPFGPPPSVKQALKGILETEGLPVITQYPDPRSRRLKALLAERHNLTPTRIAIGNGAAELIELILDVVRPSVVGIVYPAFSAYTSSAKKRDIEIVPLYGEEESHFLPPVERLCELVRKTDLVFLGYPNNPTGLCISFDELKQVAKEAIRCQTVLVVDEAFLDFIPDGERMSLIGQIESYPSVILLRSLTKFHALAGVRLGYAVASPKWVKRLEQRQVPWSVNAVAQVLGEAALQDQEYEQRVREWVQQARMSLRMQLSRIPGLKVYPSETNYLLVRLEREGKTAAWLQEQLGQQGILIRNCADYPGLDERYFRVAVRTDEDHERLVKVLKQCLDEDEEAASS